MLDTLKYTKKLEGVGLNRKQAETYIEIMSEVLESNLATTQNLKDVTHELRSEIKELGQELRSEIKELGQELRSEIKDLGQELRSEIKTTEYTLRGEMIAGFTKVSVDLARLEHRMTLRLAGIVAAGAALAVSLNKLIN